MAVLNNLRGGTIRVASDAPVFFGTPTQITDTDAKRIRELAHVKAYVESGALTIELDSEIRNKKKAESEKPQAKTIKKSKES